MCRGQFVLGRLEDASDGSHVIQFQQRLNLLGPLAGLDKDVLDDLAPRQGQFRMLSNLLENGPYLRIFGCQREALRCLDVAFKHHGLASLRHKQLERHFRRFGIITLVNVRPVTLHRQPDRPLAGEARDVSGQTELDRVHHTALARPVRSRNDKALAARGDVQSPDSAQLPYINGLHLNHGEPSFGFFARTATKSSGFSFFPDCRALRSASTVALSIVPSFDSFP